MQGMSSKELRIAFLEFFQKHGHTVVPSSSLIPDDPSVLLTTAGMQQFKPYYTGAADPMVSPHPTLGGKSLGSRNAASIQKSFRTSDIDEVGDERHLTFFEMMGNFSFGGYFKKEAIAYGYDFLKNTLGLEIDYVTVFDPEKVPEGDWRKHGVPFDEESHKLWKGIGMPESKIRREGVDNFWGPTGGEGPCGPTTEIYIDGIEVWNIVFNQFYCDKTQKLTPLKIQGVDTGMGLERLAMVSQGKANIFETDLFADFISLLPKTGFTERSKRILADHVRAISFLISDGVLPSNKYAGYVLRRLIRRVIVHEYLYALGNYNIAEKTGIERIHTYALLKNVIENYKETYPELNERILKVFEEENKKFRKTLDIGLQELYRTDTIDAKSAFKLYESYGLPFEVIKELGRDKTRHLRRGDFDKEFEKHQAISRAGQERKFGGHGLLLDTGELKAANEAELERVTRLHTATHLLQAALRKVLGESVHQAGSDITAERTRFDFTFDRKLTPEELKQVEDLVNKAIQDDLTVSYEEMPYENAIQTGALHFAKEKYPPKVKVYTMDSKYPEPFSKELCGGPHVTHTGQVGKFKILKEESVGAGLRRLRAVLD